MTLSVLMPAKNVTPFVEDALKSLQATDAVDWELIVVDDHSSDDTWEILDAAAERDNRIRPFRNSGHGKVAGLNLAYSHAKGDFITTLDADDLLDSRYFEYLVGVDLNVEAFVRDYIVTDSSLSPLGTYRMARALLDGTFEEAVMELRSLPRATWTLRRSVAERVFPVPEDLPFEDVWFSLVTKKFARKIASPRLAVYYYRQHEGQTFGGVLNYGPEKSCFRAARLNQYATLLPNYADRFDISSLPDLSRVRNYYGLMMQEQLSIGQILRADLSQVNKLKLLFFKKLWFLVGGAKRLQWWMENLRA